MRPAGRRRRRSERAKIANGFDFPAGAHGGRTKARPILLLRANQFLQRASVQGLPAEAFARGERVLVSTGTVFWYEEEGRFGRRVKETGSTRDSEGATLLREGTIWSTNDGRLVVRLNRATLL